MFEIIIIIGIVAIIWVVSKGLIKCQGDPSWYYMGKSIDELQTITNYVFPAKKPQIERRLGSIL